MLYEDHVVLSLALQVLWLKDLISLNLTLTRTSWSRPKSHPWIVHFLLGSLGIKKNLWNSSKKLHMQESKVRSSRKCGPGLEDQRASSWAEIVLKQKTSRPERHRLEIISARSEELVTVGKRHFHFQPQNCSSFLQNNEESETGSKPGTLLVFLWVWICSHSSKFRT